MKKKDTKLKWRKLRWVTVLELLVLLDNVIKASEDPDVGFEDPEETIKSFTFRLNRPVRIYTKDLESALWSCNLLNEKGAFKHPWRLSFDDFLKKLLRGDAFNKDYNFIEGESGETI